jgi:glycosyltransferase involved in cell wall biosynthesis
LTNGTVREHCARASSHLKKGVGSVTQAWRHLRHRAMGRPADQRNTPRHPFSRKAITLLADMFAKIPIARSVLNRLLAYAPDLKIRLQSTVARERFRRAEQSFAALQKTPRRPTDPEEITQAHAFVDGVLKGRTLYVFVDHTVVHPVNTGVQRVARGLARGLLSLGETVRFVRWDAEAQQCVLIDLEQRRHLARWNGPDITPEDSAVYGAPGEPTTAVPKHAWCENSWLIVPEVTHITTYGSPVTLDVIGWARRSGLRSGIVFYDAIPLRRPEYADVVQRHSLYMQQLRLADAVWPISQFSADDLISFWSGHECATSLTMPETHAVPLAGDPGGPRSRDIAEERGGLILCVGTIEERKNQLQLIEAFQAFQKRCPETGWRLVFAGNLHPSVLTPFLLSMKHGISFEGTVSDERLKALYAECAFTVFPSVEEGFGLPILESLWHGKPCICADFGAMGEVAQGGGCLTVDARDKDLLSQAIEQLATDSGLRRMLAEQAVTRPIETWPGYASAITARVNEIGSPQKRIGTIYYWIDATVGFPHNTGIQRVARQLARELLDAGFRIVPVKWDDTVGGMGPVSPEDLAHFGRWNGPRLEQWSPWRAPERRDRRSWLVLSELPLNRSAAEQSQLLDSARNAGLGVAAIFYDAIPWKMRDIYPPAFSHAHRQYMKELADYDLVFSISNASREDLLSFLRLECGVSEPLDDKIVHVALAGEFKEGQRVAAPVVRHGNSEVSILCVGTIEPRKNHETLLQAFAKVHERHRQDGVSLRLTLAGGSHSIDPSLAERVRAFVAAHPGITWEENADDTRLRELHAACDFTIYPSVEEGFGLPIAESLWYGKPCICANFGAMAEVAKGGGCLAVDVRDPDALADAIERLARDGALQTSLVEQARSRPLKSWQRYGQEIAALLGSFEPGVGGTRASTAVGTVPAPECGAGVLLLPPRPLLSICITTYNRGEWLAASLASWNRLYPQPVSDVELLVCDNASTDHTSEVVKPFLVRSDFSYRRNPFNVGMLGNLRETAHHARGQFIWIIGDDDILMPGAIERVVAALRGNPQTSLVYLNYAFTRLSDARSVTDFDAFFREATPIVEAEPDKVGPIREICARNENFFTAIYTLVLRRDHALNAYSQDTSGRPFSTMLTCVPTTSYVLHTMMDEAGVWIGTPQLVVNMNVSWMKYAPLWILERIPEVYETAERMGVAKSDIDRWRAHTLPGAVHYFREIFEEDPAGNAAFFSPARFVRRFRTLPEFERHRRTLIGIYEAAHKAGHRAAGRPTADVFPAD